MVDDGNGGGRGDGRAGSGAVEDPGGSGAVGDPADPELADDLPALLTLERVDRDLFRARNANLGPRQTLYGGQVAAQCLLAAASTVEEGRLPHSFHGYFLRPGRVDLPVILRVDRDRDGRSFSARHVVAIQEGEVIFSMLTSFHAESESGVYDGALHRGVPQPEDNPRGGRHSLIEVREVTPTDFLKGTFTDCLWARSTAALGDDPLIHRAALTYLSDLGTGFGQRLTQVKTRGGPSIDHAMWFQQNIRADDWVLVDLDPVKAWGSRGVYQGALRDRHGTLGATLYQEHLLLPGTMDDVSEEMRQALAELRHEPPD